MRRKTILSKVISTVLCSTLLIGIADTGMMPKVQAANEGLSNSAFNADEFADASKIYQPGVRWWWPGGAVEKEELLKEINYLAENNFGAVEINPFEVSSGLVSGTEEAYTSIYTPEFYELLDYAITELESRDITVDLNMGSGWNANSASVSIEDTMGNMALGRATVSGSELVGGSEISIPAVEKSKFYDEGQDGNWSEENVKLQGVMIAKINEDTTGTALTKWNTTTVDGTGEKKTYSSQTVIDVKDAMYYTATEDMINTKSLSLNEEILSALAEDANYEIIALYYVPSGGEGIDSVNDWYVVDHMDGEKTVEYINDWLGESYLNAIFQKHSNIRSLFNDSYEFYSDMYYTEEMANLAADSQNNQLGYDFSKYLPLLYKETSAAPYYKIAMGLFGTNDTFLSSGNSSEMNRIKYDYNLLVNQKFQEGMAGFQESTNNYGLTYRQQAYNPPIDTIGSAQYIDVPDSEQGKELDLIRVSSGAHLYGKNIVASEQYTLGTVPFTNTLEAVKIGYDVMATSGVNSFFYHGLNYKYGEDTELYGENGWSPWPNIGINVSDENTLYKYFKTMNSYAARLNYMMQLGKESSDVALYMPFNGSLTDTDAVKALNYNGYTWDAINDDSIINTQTVYSDGKISVNGGTMVYDVIIVESSALPLETMEKLESLAEAGATIIFYNVDTAKMTIPGYADGNYAEEDAKVSESAIRTTEKESGYLVSDMSDLAQLLAEKVKASVSYEYNENARYTRRTLPDGGELLYIRNIGADTNTITLKVDEKYENCYWLDQNTGKIYPAARNEDGTISFTIDASKDTYIGYMGGTGIHSMAIGLLCEPAGVIIASDNLTSGVPDTINTAQAAKSETLTPVSLEVTADNFDSVIGGEVETRTYTENVLGKWNDSSFQEGQLQNIVSDGVYTIHYNVSDEPSNGKYELNLGSVYTAAEVRVNGTYLGQLSYSPYSIDVTSALKKGDNEIIVSVTPRKLNRYYNTTNGQYSTTTLLDAGLEGPVTMEVSNYAASVKLNKSTASLSKNSTLQLEATVSYSDGTKTWDSLNSTIEWTSNNGEVATVSASGLVTAKKAGTAIIMATVDGITATCNITVEETPVKVTTITLSKSNIALYTKDLTTTTLTATVTGSNSAVTWKSNNTSVATVSSAGLVTAKKEGTATITATVDKTTATCIVTVMKPKVTLSKSKVTLYTKGSTTTTLKATVFGASNKVTWKSSKPSVATVSSSGKVTAKKVGTTTITATANGAKITCTITVKNPTLTLSKSKASIKVGKTVTIKATAKPSAKIKYSSSNKKIATVNSSGVVKGIKKGTATITVSCNGVKKTFKVTVKK